MSKSSFALIPLTYQFFNSVFYEIGLFPWVKSGWDMRLIARVPLVPSWWFMGLSYGRAGARIVI